MATATLRRTSQPSCQAGKSRSVSDTIAKVVDAAQTGSQSTVPLDPKTLTREPVVREDPVFDAIERFRKASKAFWEYPTPAPDDDPAFDAACKLESQAWDNLIRCTPTSAAGLQAYADVMVEQYPLERIEEYGCTATVLATMARSGEYLAAGQPARQIEDPVFALIEQHKTLWPRIDEIDSDDGDNPEWVQAVEEAYDAMQEIADCEPTTLAGCRAAAVYISEHPCNKGFGDTEMIRDAFARSLKALVP